MSRKSGGEKGYKTTFAHRLVSKLLAWCVAKTRCPREVSAQAKFRRIPWPTATAGKNQSNPDSGAVKGNQEQKELRMPGPPSTPKRRMYAGLSLAAQKENEQKGWV